MGEELKPAVSVTEGESGGEGRQRRDRLAGAQSAYPQRPRRGEGARASSGSQERQQQKASGVDEDRRVDAAGTEASEPPRVSAADSGGLRLLMHGGQLADQRGRGGPAEAAAVAAVAPAATETGGTAVNLSEERRGSVCIIRRQAQTDYRRVVAAGAEACSILGESASGYASCSLPSAEGRRGRSAEHAEHIWGGTNRNKAHAPTPTAERRECSAASRTC